MAIAICSAPNLNLIDDDSEWLKIEQSPEFIASIAKAREQVRRGECVTHEQLLAELGCSAE